MDAIEALLTRNSMARLTAPAPSREQLDIMYQAALRAPDHALLRPWRILEVQGDGLRRLGTLFAEALQAGQPDADEAAVERARNAPLRAPLVLVVAAKVVEHPKVPAVEQLLSAAAAAQNIMLAAHAMGLGGIWRTGAFAYDEHIKRGLGLEPQDQIVGYLYLGTPAGSHKKVPALQMADFVERWGE